MSVKKPSWPSTFVEALSWHEVRKILNAVYFYVPEDVSPSVWQILLWILVAVAMQGS